MFETEAQIVTRNGIMPTFIARPEGGAPFPPVIVYMDAPGIREELRNIARRIAGQGYYCLLPDMYYRLGTMRFNLLARDERMSAVIGACLRHLDNDRVNDDTAGMLSFLDADPYADSARVSCVGHCMSGRYAIAAAAKFGARFASAVSLYGVGLMTEDEGSPHRLIANIPGELYFGFAETDTAAPPETIEGIRRALRDGGPKHEVEVFANSRHGYQFVTGSAYEPSAAEATWRKMFELWDRTLKGKRTE